VPSGRTAPGCSPHGLAPSEGARFAHAEAAHRLAEEARGGPPGAFLEPMAGREAHHHLALAHPTTAGGLTKKLAQDIYDSSGGREADRLRVWAWPVFCSYIGCDYSRRSHRPMLR
jgi:hypothetical protein